MKRRKGTLPLPKEHVTRDVILDILKLGVVLGVGFTAPKALQLLRPWICKDYPHERYYPSSIDRSVTRLWRSGFVDVHETAKGTVVVLNKKGKREVLLYDLSGMKIPEQKDWDGLWRMVFFDIPTSEEARHEFRKHLKRMGFFPMQRSVYVYPFPCRKEIAYLREIYGLPHYIKLATVHSLENDHDLRTFFHLK